MKDDLNLSLMKNWTWKDNHGRLIKYRSCSSSSQKNKSIKYLEVDEIEMAGLEIDLGGGATLNGE